MFETLIVKPIFNVLALIYALIPGHDFGISVILFTVVVRFALWPLLKKQLHQTRMMRTLQPEIKKIKIKSKGNKQKESQLLMELYKERGVNPLGSIGVLLLQLPILIGLFQGLKRIADNKETIFDLSYGWVQDLSWMQHIRADISSFDETLLGLVDLTRTASGAGGLYLPVLIIAGIAAILQFYQSKQLIPKQSDAKKIGDILRQETKGKRADQSEINAAVMSKMIYIFPVMTFIFAASVPGALGLYWATGSLVGFLQQRAVLNKDVEEMEEVPINPEEDKPKSKVSKKRGKK